MICLGFRWIKEYTSISGAKMGKDNTYHNCLVFRRRNLDYIIPTTTNKGKGKSSLQTYLMEMDGNIIQSKVNDVNVHFLNELIYGNNIKIGKKAKFIESSEPKVLRTLLRKLKKQSNDVFVHNINTLKGSRKLSSEKEVLEDLINSLEDRISLLKNS